MSYPLRREHVVDVAGLQAMLEHSPGQAAQAILAAAGQGVVEAQLLLGQILLDGRGIEQDALVARRWFAIAAQAGSAMAHNMLGRCLEHGWGGEVSLAQAAIHYARAADAGLDWGLYNLGNLLATGRGVPANQAQALACYEKAAHMGHAKSMNLYGRYLEQGIATVASPARAVRWYRRSAEAGDFRGMFSLAMVLAERGALADACVWLARARAQGNLAFLRSSVATLLAAGPLLSEQAIGFMNEISRREEVSPA
ncbi:sel1 repeat family protein [Pseudomonas entomophila]|uniref:tetratricopeptide repeat protein n=1 Tax=Pseudomonas entomophila TaxID=312306 RepID=UPI001BCC6E4E|nr:tetratricopeptide repeat protein [Pseudomonas entomophila]QVM92360.1 sel1 repeat family protein [Pseudomonas entomophila]